MRRRRTKETQVLTRHLFGECMQQVFVSKAPSGIGFSLLLESSFNTQESAPYKLHFLKNNNNKK